jgi:hypothetical protein
VEAAGDAVGAVEDISAPQGIAHTLPLHLVKLPQQSSSFLQYPSLLLFVQPLVGSLHCE